jgi:hypothetical protein
MYFKPGCEQDWWGFLFWTFISRFKTSFCDKKVGRNWESLNQQHVIKQPITCMVYTLICR